MSSPSINAVTAYVALGSNLGDRRDYLDRALAALRAQPGVRVEKISRYHETVPMGGPPGQGNYLNAAVELRTTLNARQLLEAMQEIETNLGRVRSEHWGPRTIDLDMLLYGDLVTDDPELTLPHRRLHERLFVLAPLVEIAPDAVHPLLGQTIRELFDKQVRREARPKTRPALGTAGRELAGLRAVVTGSTSGIGRAIAFELASAGADVIVHGRRSWETAQAIAAQLSERGVRSRAVLGDVANPEHRTLLVDTALEEGPVDIWINNAGADTLTGEATEWTFEQKLEQLLAVDVWATVALSRAVGARMKAAGRGCIVNMGWDQADIGMEGDSGELFTTAKGAVMAFTRSLALSLAPEVRVNCLAPGWIRTAWGESASSVWQERVKRETPLARWGRPEDVAAACRWLVSPAAAFITGQIIRVNGGVVRG
jgi:2-amino-4-hydroxy-6-hydroxymethyldihydropteridine diphosphokinase